MKHTPWLAMSSKQIDGEQFWTPVQMENGIAFDIMTPGAVEPREHDEIVRLIAAAPELLEALKHAERVLTLEYPKDAPVLANARAALKKAGAQ